MCSVYLCHPDSFPLSPSMGNFWRKDSKSEIERTCHGRLARTKRFTPQLLNKLLTSLSDVHQCPALDLAPSFHPLPMKFSNTNLLRYYSNATQDDGQITSKQPHIAGIHGQFLWDVPGLPLRICTEG